MFFFGFVTYSFSSGSDQNLDVNASDSFVDKKASVVDAKGAKFNPEQQNLPLLKKQESPVIQFLFGDSEESSAGPIKRLAKIENDYNELYCNSEKAEETEDKTSEMEKLFTEHLKICISLLSRNELEPGYLCEYFGNSPWQEMIRKTIKLDGKELSEEIAYATGVYLCGFVLFKNGQTSENVSSLYKNAITAASLKKNTSNLLKWAISQAKNDQETQKLASTLKPILDFVKNYTCLDK